MLFNSIPFLAFILVFFCIWPLANRSNTGKWLWICCMSFLFYGWWDWRFLFLLLGTGSVDYFAGKFILTFPSRKKLWLWLSLSVNILSLIIFKYSEWLASLLDTGFGMLHLQTAFQSSIPEFTLVLPVGISFYTFNSMSYTIDLYRGKAKPAHNLLHFFAFISFFPHLVAGPIIRAKDILGQLSKNRSTDAIEILNGIRTCIWGFFQKMVLADNIAVLVNDRFNNVLHTTDSLEWWICMSGFAFQIYFDFNGYSTIARGIAKLCGIHFRLNFNHPYFAGSFRNFWQRWHISLSGFFRDYFYIPLGGNRKSKLRNHLNLWLTMLVSGLWHGANITFIIWGGLHALYLTLEKWISNHVTLPIHSILRNILSVFFVFIPVTIAWVFFRSSDLNQALYIIKQMLCFHSDFNLKELFLSNAVFWLMAGIALELLSQSAFSKRLNHKLIPSAFVSLLLLVVTIFFRGPEQQFIYFQF